MLDTAKAWNNLGNQQLTYEISENEMAPHKGLTHPKSPWMYESEFLWIPVVFDANRASILHEIQIVTPNTPQPQSSMQDQRLHVLTQLLISAVPNTSTQILNLSTSVLHMVKDLPSAGFYPRRNGSLGLSWRQLISKINIEQSYKILLCIFVQRCFLFPHLNFVLIKYSIN